VNLKILFSIFYINRNSLSKQAAAWSVAEVFEVFEDFPCSYRIKKRQN